jgi:hypothetical protein
VKFEEDVDEKDDLATKHYLLKVTMAKRLIPRLPILLSNESQAFSRIPI